MKKENATLFHENLMFFKASKRQKKYLEESTYNLTTPGGRNFERTFELLAQSILSGKILVKEKMAFGSDQYEKVYVLSPEGETEKYRGENFDTSLKTNVG